MSLALLALYCARGLQVDSASRSNDGGIQMTSSRLHLRQQSAKLHAVGNPFA